MQLKPAAQTAISDKVVLGVVTKPHGVRGALRVKVFNDDTELLFAGQLLRVSQPESAVEDFIECSISDAHPANDVWILKLDGVDSIDEAESLRGAELWVERSVLPEPESDEFYFIEAPLMTVVDEAGTFVAKVIRAQSYPSTDVVVCLLDGAEVEWSLAAGVFVGFDRAARTLIISSEYLQDHREQTRVEAAAAAVVAAEKAAKQGA